MYRGEREVLQKGKRSRSEKERSEWEDYFIKAAAARASPSVVTLISHHVPVEMCSSLGRYREATPSPGSEFVFKASGLVIECQSQLSSHSPTTPPNYLCTILAPASLFHRTPPTPTPPHHIQIDVIASTGSGHVVHKGNLLDCDFHYNLAAISIISNIPLPTVTLKPIDDVISIDPLTHPPILSHNPPPPPFQLCPHSNLFNIYPGSPILSIYRSYSPPHSITCTTGAFCTTSPKELSSCDELYKITRSRNLGCDGGPVINPLGEVIGIIFAKTSFLPSNVVLRWWNHYKCFGKLRRPFLGIEVINLYDADLNFLSRFITKFPNISTAIVVEEVMEDSQSCCSEIRANDVIVSLDGKLVRSKLEFYEAIWEKAGKSVEAKVLRVSDGEELNLSIVIKEASENQFHQWPHPTWGKSKIR